MKSQSILVPLALSVVLGTVRASAQTPVYHANLMGISDGRTNIQVEHATRLNRWGQVIGTYGGGLSGGTHAVLWTPDAANDGSGNAINGAGSLFGIESSSGLPAGTADTGTTGLNDRGQVVGQAFTPGQGDGNQTQSWMWKPKTLNSNKGVLHGNSGKAVTFPLLTIPGLGTLAEYNQIINNKGVIGAYGINYRALLWTPSVPNGLLGDWTFDPANGGGPAAINDAGQIAGSTCENSIWNGPYLHSGALPLLVTDVLTSPLWIPPSSQECVGGVSGMNVKGDLAISAVSSSVNAIHAYLYKNGAATDISTGFSSQTSAINNYDQVVGHVDSDTRRAYLFQNGQAFDLNGLNDSTNGVFLGDSLAINDSGQILCGGVFSGAGSSTVLLTPNALVINPVTFTLGALQHNGSTYTQVITLTNKGTTTITGPISVALDGLPSGVTLTNATGTTMYTGPGSAYVDVSASDLVAGSTTSSFTLVFSNPGHVAIKFKGRALGSPAAR